MENPRRLAHSLLVICLSLGAVLTAPERKASAQSSAGDEYRALLERYRSVDTKGAVAAMSERDDRWLESAVTSALRTAATWPAARLEAAALLHTEVVTGGWVLSQHVATHLLAARRFLDLDRGRLVPPAFRRTWLLAICWHYQSEMELGALVPWLDELRLLAPSDPEMLLVEGTFYETLAWNATPPADLAWDRRSKTLSAIASRSRVDILGQAAASFRRAATAPAVHDAASVRLGRTLTELGRADEARDVLSPLVTSASERRWRYLAALFLAQAESTAARPDSAAAAYSRAASLMPGCQTPQVGLTALRRLAGEPLVAADLAEALTRDQHACDDPWWFYRFGQPPDRLPQLLSTLREPLLQ